MSKKRSKVRFQNEVDLIKVHYKKQSRGQSLTCLDMFNGRRHLRKRSAAGILCGSLLLTVISATVLGKTTTVVYASDIEKYTNHFTIFFDSPYFFQHLICFNLHDHTSYIIILQPCYTQGILRRPVRFPSSPGFPCPYHHFCDVFDTFTDTFCDVF